MAKLTREEVLEIVEKAHKQGERPNLSRADLSEADLSWADLIGANLSKANLSGTKLNGARLIGADLTGTDLSGVADLSVAYLSKADLSGANLTGAYLSETDLTLADLSGANLSGAYLSEADLSGANLSGADLSEADLSEANLSEADLSGADLSWADLSGAHFTEIKLDNTDFSNALIGKTIFVAVDLSQAKGLTTIHHNGPSIIDINTIYQSKDKIPKEFLEKAGVHPDIIRWQHSLHTRPTVFISYNHKDEKKKDHLLTHLRALERKELIDVWHDARIQAGAEWKQEIKQAIAKASVAILLISANFLASDFINEEEIPQFLTRRKSDKKLVIFPIIAKRCAWRQLDWLAEMQVRPKGGQAIWGKSQNIDIDAELAKIATEVEEIIKNLWLRGD